jgi:hypothetical protein
VLAKENIDVEPRSAPQQIHTGPGAGAVAQPA